MALLDLAVPRASLTIDGLMKLLPLVMAILVGLEATAAQAASPLPVAKPPEAGMSAERLQRVGAFVEQLQRDQKIAGAVTVVARQGKLVQLEAHGFADVEGKRALRTDDLEEGDAIITSGTDGIFPAGLMVGRLTAIQRKTSGPLQGAEPIIRFLRATRAVGQVDLEYRELNGRTAVVFVRDGQTFGALSVEVADGKIVRAS